jgi:cell division septation protein DedD
MDNKATTKRMIGAVVLVLVAALLLAWLLKGKNREGQEQMAIDQAGETKPILGFPDTANPEQKPSVVGENQNAAQQNDAQDQGIVDQATNAVKDAAGNIKDAAGNIVPNVNTVSDTTGFELRPAAPGETRKAVEKDGTAVSTTGSLGSGNPSGQGKDTQAQAKDTAKPGATQQQAADTSASSKNTSSKDVADTSSQSESSKPASRPVLVNEKRVPTPASADNKAKADAEKAAKAKSQELAKQNAAKASSNTASSASGGGSYAVQVLATSDKGKANAAAAPLRADGYQVSVTAAKVDGKTVYRVLVGSYANKVAASAAQAKMKGRYTQNTGIQNSFITGGK